MSEFFKAPSGIVYESFPIMFIQKMVRSEDDKESINKQIQLYKENCISDEQRCPLVTVDMLLFYEDPSGKLYVPIGQFDKVKTVLSGGTQRITGAVMSGGHVEASEDPDIPTTAYRELEEEFGITEYKVPLQLVIEYTHMNVDPRNRLITHIFVGVTKQKPHPTEEMSKVALVPAKELYDIIRDPTKKVTFPDGTTLDFVLGHRDKIYCAMMCGLTKKIMGLC
jgi:8-oxo-dGTP pyrophosphatase MutT (NUDIX family)